MDLNDIRQLLAEYEIKFIRLAFCDIFGRQKNIAIMADEFEHALTRGVSFDASAISGFLNVDESDLLLFPDLGFFRGDLRTGPWPDSTAISSIRTEDRSKVMEGICFPGSRNAVPIVDIRSSSDRNASSTCSRATRTGIRLVCHSTRRAISTWLRSTGGRTSDVRYASPWRTWGSSRSAVIMSMVPARTRSTSAVHPRSRRPTT